MKNFIKLSSLIINKKHISYIKYNPDPKYYNIHMDTYNFTGWLDGGKINMSGNISSYNDIIKITEKNNKQDFDKITDIFNDYKN
jgi:hypothetical protein